MFLFHGKIIASQFKVHTDFINIVDGKAYMDIYIISDSNETVNLNFQCEHSINNENENQRIAIINKSSVELTKGMNKIQLKLSDRENSNNDVSYFQIIKKFQSIPVGEYHINISIFGNADTCNYKSLRIKESELSPQSSFSKNIDNDVKRANRKIKIVDVTRPEFISNLEKELQKKGITFQCKIENKIQFIYLYSDNYFLGKYRVPKVNIGVNTKELKEQVFDKKETIIQNGLENYESIFSQFKKDKRDESQEAVGHFGISANIGNQQAAFSNQDKNYYEVDGNVELPIFDIPISITGFYTTQDIRRMVKSSYIHFHYDAAKAKEKIMKLIGNYKGEYEVVESKGKGLEASYRTFIHSLEGQKDALFYQLISQTGLKDYTAIVDSKSIKHGDYSIDTTKLLQLLMSKSDSLQSNNPDQLNIQSSKDSVQQVYRAIMKKYAEFKALQQKYEKYSTLLNQYKNTTYFDSLLAYDNVKDLKNYEDMSYKDLVKTATNLLPEGKVKKITTGITSMNLGMFSKYNSKYTLGGQQVKGIDIGYDIGFAEASITTGKTEFIGRNGDIDRYTFYTGSLKCKPVLKQQFDIIYYGYSPSRRMFNENKEFFKNLNMSMPTFQNPGHIFSIKQEGTFIKQIHTESEVAYSVKRSNNDETIQTNVNNNLAYSISLDGDIPKTTVSIATAYEHVGREFENNTLPFTAKGTDRIRIGAKSSFFKNILHLGIEYNYLLQHNITSTFRNARWGFDFKTKSKRYPTISISYKPFSTYRSYTDTMLIPQRPLFGNVWTCKANYQYKKDNQIYKILLLYNKSNSSLDTTQISNELFQLSFFYLNKSSMTNLSISKINFNSTTPTSIPSWHYQNSYMISMGENYTWKKNIQTNAGLDLGVSKYGISSMGGNVGITYRAPKSSMIYRLNTRYMHFKLQETTNWQNVFRGTLDIIWQFRYKLNDFDKTN